MAEPCQHCGEYIGHKKSCIGPSLALLSAALERERSLHACAQKVIEKRDSDVAKLGRVIADLRAEHAKTKAELAEATKCIEWLNAQIKSDSDHGEKMQADLDAAQAEAAALSDAAKALIAFLVVYDTPIPGGNLDVLCKALNRAITDGVMGKSLAARVTLLEAVFYWARKLSDKNRVRRQHARASQTEIELAKAVAVLAALDEKGGTDV